MGNKLCGINRAGHPRLRFIAASMRPLSENIVSGQYLRQFYLKRAAAPSRNTFWKCVVDLRMVQLQAVSDGTCTETATKRAKSKSTSSCHHACERPAISYTGRFEGKAVADFVVDEARGSCVHCGGGGGGGWLAFCLKTPRSWVRHRS